MKLQYTLKIANVKYFQTNLIFTIKFNFEVVIFTESRGCKYQPIDTAPVRWAGGKPSTWFPSGGCRADTKTESERNEKAHEQRSKGKRRSEKLNNETNKETKKDEEEEGEEENEEGRREEGTRRKEKEEEVGSRK